MIHKRTRHLLETVHIQNTCTPHLTNSEGDLLRSVLGADAVIGFQPQRHLTNQVCHHHWCLQKERQERDNYIHNTPGMVELYYVCYNQVYQYSFEQTNVVLQQATQRIDGRVELLQYYIDVLNRILVYLQIYSCSYYAVFRSLNL